MGSYFVKETVKATDRRKKDIVRFRPRDASLERLMIDFDDQCT
jgi:hypothetical protein